MIAPLGYSARRCRGLNAHRIADCAAEDSILHDHDIRMELHDCSVRLLGRCDVVNDTAIRNRCRDSMIQSSSFCQIREEGNVKPMTEDR